MRIIEKEMLRAIKNHNNWSKSNTSCKHESKNKSEVYLFGNHIGDFWYNTGKFETDLKTLLNWPSVTTISRLRALDVNVRQKNWKIYIDNELIGDKLKYDVTDGTYKNKELL